MAVLSQPTSALGAQTDPFFLFSSKSDLKHSPELYRRTEQGPRKLQADFDSGDFLKEILSIGQTDTAMDLVESELAQPIRETRLIQCQKDKVPLDQQTIDAVEQIFKKIQGYIAPITFEFADRATQASLENRITNVAFNEFFQETRALLTYTMRKMRFKDPKLATDELFCKEENLAHALACAAFSRTFKEMLADVGKKPNEQFLPSDWKKLWFKPV